MHRRQFLQTMAALSCVPALQGDSPPRRDVAWLADVQRLPAATALAASPLTPLLVTDEGRPIATIGDWEPRRKQLRTAWLDFLGPLSRELLAARAAGAPCTPPELTVLETDVVDGVERQLVRYVVEADQPVEAYLLRPVGLASPAPGVVVFHSTVAESLRQPAGVEGAEEKAFGLQLAQRGCVAICPRNYLWPENHRIDAAGEAARFLTRHPQSKGMDRMLLDGLIAVDLLSAQAHVDPQRMGCIGHSLGAKEALYLAAFDERVQVTVSSEGGIGTTFSNWHDAWYLGPSIREPGFAREHQELLALIAPRAFLLVGGDSADGDPSWPFITAAAEVYRLFDDSPRLGLLNHRLGHAVPPEAHAKMLEWMLTYL